MALFILMTRLTPGSVKDAETRRAMGKEWLEKVKSACPEVKWVSHYALLGQYDFMDIYEAPDDETTRLRIRLARDHPRLRARVWENNRRTEQVIVDALVETGTARLEAVVATGAALGAITAALGAVRQDGHRVGHVHLRHLNPFPRGLGELLEGEVLALSLEKRQEGGASRRGARQHVGA